MSGMEEIERARAQVDREIADTESAGVASITDERIATDAELSRLQREIVELEKDKHTLETALEYARGDLAASGEVERVLRHQVYELRKCLLSVVESLDHFTSGNVSHHKLNLQTVVDHRWRTSGKIVDSLPATVAAQIAEANAKVVEAAKKRAEFVWRKRNYACCEDRDVSNLDHFDGHPDERDAIDDALTAALREREEAGGGE